MHSTNNLTHGVFATSVPATASDAPFLTTALIVELGWNNVVIALSFILFDTFVSGVLKIGVGSSLLISAIRCMIQLTVVATILQQVFAAEDQLVIAGITGVRLSVCSRSYVHITASSVLLNVLGTVEIGVVYGSLI